MGVTFLAVITVLPLIARDEGMTGKARALYEQRYGTEAHEA